MLCGLILLSASRVHAFSDGEAIKSIIGEAENQHYSGMLAIACAIRNRHTLEGVYGLKAPRVVNHKYSANTFRKAKLAWSNSKDYDVTNGATHWENVNAFGKPYWIKSMKMTVIIGDHRFYKPIEKGIK